MRQMRATDDAGPPTSAVPRCGGSAFISMRGLQTHILGRRPRSNNRDSPFRSPPRRRSSPNCALIPYATTGSTKALNPFVPGISLAYPAAPRHPLAELAEGIDDSRLRQDMVGGHEFFDNKVNLAYAMLLLKVADPMGS
jgi:hypothetical protein